MKTRFDDLVSTRKAKAGEKPAERKKRTRRARTSKEASHQGKPFSEPTPAPIVAEGKQTGKRSDTGYTQVSAYIRRDTHRDVKAALVLGESDQDFGDLVDELLQEWLADLPDEIRQALPSQRKK